MKKKKGLVLCLCLAFLATATVGLATGCGNEGDKPSNKVENPIEYGEDGVYYCDTDEGEFLIDLQDAAFTWTFGSRIVSGTYTYDGRVLTFKADGGAETTATLKDGVLTLAYGEEPLTFLTKVNYTVKFDVGGSAEIVNGRTLSKPADPSKEGQLFVGWYKDSGFKNKFDFSEAIKGDMTLYARFVEIGDTEDEFTATLMVDGETFGTQKTVGGVLYNLPTPEKEGKKFAGWWVSHSGDENKLTYKYEEQTVSQHETLYAVWETGAPLVSVNEKGVTWTAPGVGNSYTVKVTAPDGKDTSRTQGTTTYDYNFAGKAEGEYIVEVTVGDKTTTAYYTNKGLAKVSLFSVNGNVLVWNAVEGAEEYLLTVDCAEASHNHTEQSNGKSTTFDFTNCGMKKGGLTFSVKAVANGHVASESEEFVIERNLAAAENFAFDAQAKLTWAAVENAETYVVKVNGDPYTTSETEFDLRHYTGELTVSVTPVAAGYNSPDEAPMSYTKDTLASPKNISLNATTLNWPEIAGANGYVVIIDGREFTSATNSFVLTSEHYDETKTSCSVIIRALGADAASNSIDSLPVTINFGSMSEAPVYQNGKVSWQPALNVSKFEVKVGDADAVEVAADKTEYAVAFTTAGEQTISVRCFNNATGTPSAWVSVTVNVYKVTFEVEGGTALESTERVQYKAKGDSLTLPSTTRRGYEFDNWYNAKTDGAKFTGTTFENEVDTTYYAYWKAETYNVTLIAIFQGEEVYRDEISVAYDSTYNLGAVKTLEEKAIYFGGWYTEPNAVGDRYTDANGDSLEKWTRTDGITLYADWIEVLSYEKVKATNGVDDVYQVSKGDDISSVTEVTIPAMFNGLPVTTVAASAFSGCTKLTTIRIPNTILNIEVNNGGNYTGSAFRNCTGLTAVEIYEVEGGVIPESYYEDIDGVLIYNNQFTGKELKYYPLGRKGDAVLPEGVTILPTNIFRNYSIKTITIPASVTNIDAGAFMDSKVENIIFASTTAGEASVSLAIAASAFDGCDSLKSITLPARLSSFDISLFADCDNLSEIHFEAGNADYSSKDGLLCNADGTEILYAPKGFSGELIIPNGVTSIADNAFFGTKVTRVVIPGFVSNIGEGAFYGIRELTEVIFQGKASDPRINIGKDAFYGIKVSSLELPENTGIVADGAFNYISTLTKLTVSAVVNSADAEEMKKFGFGEQVFYYVTDLEIGVGCPAFDINTAFGTNLRRVTVLEGEDGAKNPYIASDEDGVLFNANLTEILYYPTSRPGNYVIPDTVEVIGESVFEEKLGLTEITIGWKIKEIGKSAFEKCERLTKVIFEETPAGETAVSLVIGSSAFASCSLESLTLPSRVTELGSKAFYSAVNLPNGFELPEGVTTIGSQAFGGSSVIAGVISLPSTLKNMGETTSGSSGGLNNFRTQESGVTKFVVASGNATYMSDEQGIVYRKDAGGNPTALLLAPRIIENVVIPATVMEIYPCAFYYNKAKSITSAPREEVKTVKIYGYAFDTLLDLTTLQLPAGVEELPKYAIRYCPKVEKFEVPYTVTYIEDFGLQFAGSSYPSALRELTFGEVPKGATPPDYEESGYEEMLGSAAGYYKYLKSITLPDGIEWLYCTFMDLEALESVSLPASVLELEETFRGCTALKNVTIRNIEESALEYIGSYTFTDTAITSIDLPDILAEFDKNAFDGCASLVSVNSVLDDGTVLKNTLPGEITAIPTYLFRNAVSLQEITIPSGVAKTLGNYAFSGARSLKKVTFEGNKVTTIGNYAFSGCYSLQSIEIPNGVTTINKYAFSNCKALKSVTFASGSKIKTFGEACFANSGIETFVFPESTNSIALGTNMFQYCVNLESVHISTKVTSIDNLFENCSGLKEVTVADGHANLVLGEELPILMNKDGNAVRFIFKVLEVTDGVYTVPENITQIGNYAFRGQTGIKKLIIPATVTSIGTGAFANCTNLQEVEFEKEGEWNLAELGANAFQNCISLTTITNLPTSVTKLGDYAFSGCKSLNDLEFADNVTATGDHTFENCTGLTNVEFKASGVSFGSYAFAGSGLTSIYVSKSLGSYAFYNCKSLQTVTFKNSGVTSLGANAFQNCTSLTELNVPDTVTTYGNYVFSGSGLTSFTFTKDSATIGMYAFEKCSSLAQVTLPAKLEIIHYGTFSYCSSLTAIELPGTLTSIRNNAFEYSGLISIVIPEKVTSFDFVKDGPSTGDPLAFAVINEAQTFQYCTELTSVTLPATFQQLGGAAFLGCSKLTTVTGAENITELGQSAFAYSGIQTIDISKAVNYGQRIFDGCEDLAEVTLNDDVTNFGSQFMFRGTKSLKTVTLPSAMTFVEDEIFINSGLESIVIPRNVSKIGNSTFDGCASLASVTFEGEAVEFIDTYAFRNCAALETFAIPELVAKIGDSSFEGSGLRTIFIPTMLTDIGYHAFAFCSNLTAFEVEENHPVFRSEDGLLFDKDSNWLLYYPAGKPVEDGIFTLPEGTTGFSSGAFTGATAIKEIIMSDEIAVALGSGQAYAGTSFETIVIPEGVTQLFQSAFADCTNLQHITLPPTLSSLYMGQQFENTVSLRSITLPEGLTEISEKMFHNSGLESIIIPEKVTTIQANAFSDCRNLKTVYLPSSLKTIGLNAFSNSPIEHFYWYETNESGERVILGEDEIPENVYTIKGYAFSGTKITSLKLPALLETVSEYLFADCAELQNVTLPTGLKTAEKYVFYNCAKLQNVTLPTGLTEISENMFDGSGITSITIPAAVTSIAKKAFNNAAALTSVTFEHGENDLLSIGDYAFAGCASLGEISIPEKTISIGAYAFQNCTSMTSVTLPKALLALSEGVFENCTSVAEITVWSSVYGYATNVFSGWTSAQTIRFEVSEFVVSNEWCFGWDNGCSAKYEYSYAPAAEEETEA